MMGAVCPPLHRCLCRGSSAVQMQAEPWQVAHCHALYACRHANCSAQSTSTWTSSPMLHRRSSTAAPTPFQAPRPRTAG